LFILRLVICVGKDKTTKRILVVHWPESGTIAGKELMGEYIAAGK
jgi:hypothetical protein